MTTPFILTVCLLLTQTAVRSNQIRIWSNKPRLDNGNTYDSQEILPYVATRFGERGLHEEFGDKDKLLSLFTNTKKEALAKAENLTNADIQELRKLQKVRDAEAFLSEMLRVLHTLISKKTNTGNPKPNKYNHDGNIAWSYYDDLGK